MWHRSKECLVTYQVETCCGVPTIFVSGKHIRNRVGKKHHSVRRVAKYASRGNAVTLTGPISGLCTRVPLFAKINQSWEQQVYHSYILGSSYTFVKYIEGGNEAQSAQRTDMTGSNSLTCIRRWTPLVRSDHRGWQMAMHAEFWRFAGVWRRAVWQNFTTSSLEQLCRVVW